MAAAATALGFRQVLAIRPFRRLWLAQFVSIFGDFLAVFAVFSVATFRFQATAAEISYILVAFLLPLALVSPFAGVMVDRWNPRLAMVASDLVRAILALLLVFATDLSQVYVIFFALSIVSSFFIPAQSIALRTLVPSEGLLSANALMSQVMQITQIISPALAGLLVEWMGAAVCFYFDAASFVFSAALVLRLPVGRLQSAGSRLGSVLSDLGTGLKFIFTHEAIAFVMISMTVGMFAIRCFGALLAVFVRDVLVSGSSTFGLLNSLVGVGLILGTQFVHRLARRTSKDTVVVSGLLTCGVFILLPAALVSVPSTVVGMLGLGFGAALIFIPAQTLLQEVTPMPMLGRVSSSLMSALAFSQVIAMLFSGSTAARFGIRNLYLLSAAMLVVIAGLGYHNLWRRRASSP